MLKGARQVGKTWIMNEFARQYYSDSVYISFDKDAGAVSIFNDTKDPKSILERISLIRGRLYRCFS
ncbi:MAG: AAA family ATPase [Lachnospiraceae bacterium]|nr:AAA family ATPase [Lachnospiraceae bacterium]